MITKSKMRKIHITVIFIFLFTLCEAQKKDYVTNIKSMNSLENNAAIYALPKTMITITAEARRTTVIPGPFHKYADKYLGIQNVPDREITEWDISDIKIDIYQEADPEYFFSVRNKRINSLNHILTRLAEDSLILFPDRFFNKYSFSEPDTSYKNKIHYRNLSVKHNLELNNDTSYKSVFRDSIYVKIPVIKQQLVRKSTEEKAEEAASYIIKIRKRKFKLISGQYDYMPEGEALEVAVKELDKLENDYLSLFTGKEYVDYYKKTFQYVPDNTRKISKEILCRFSGTEGFIDSREARGMLVIIEIKDTDKTMYFEKINISGTGAVTGSYVPARLPDLADIRVLIGERILNVTRVPVFQYGSIVPYSIKRF